VPRFEPFAGLRYDDELAPLPEVIAPPYDIVDEAERARLAARSPYNAIGVELPVAADGLDRYAHAAALFSSWQHEGVLRRDDVAALYVYKMRFVDEESVERSTTGVIGALGLDVNGDGTVLPHERTMPKPKGDRLDLLRACRANTSPIWGLSLANGLAQACAAATAHRASSSAADDEGVIHELWPVVDPDAIAEICALVASTPVVIADGHHRYETAGHYRSERREVLGDVAADFDLVMALIVELSADELSVQAIHRLVSGLAPEVDLLGVLARYFTITPVRADPTELSLQMVSAGALGLVTGDGTYLLTPLAIVDERAEAPLDSSRLDVALAGLGPHDLVYQHGARNAAAAVTNGEAAAAFLLRPATVSQIADTAHSGRRMPPKTTFFHPKPRTGMVYRAVEG
jgi:uncharacterized protein (DUF1015 family)